jgi:heterodisulfide reductase subunit A
VLHPISQSQSEKKVEQVSNGTAIIGGGIAGIAAAIILADCGIHVSIIERQTFIGGMAAFLSCKAADTCTRCSACASWEKIQEAAYHPNITLYTNSSVESITQEAGRFFLHVVQKRSPIDSLRCIQCGICEQICPASPKAIHAPHHKGFPFAYIHEKAMCEPFLSHGCMRCLEECPTHAIDFSTSQNIVNVVPAEAVIIATGFDPGNTSMHSGLGYGKYPGVITGFDLEKDLNSTVSSQGADKTSIAFIQCIGSRDHNHCYCSRVCCKYAIRSALHMLHDSPSIRISIFYIDMQSTEKGFLPFLEQAKEKVRFIRGIPFEVTETNDSKLEVRYENIEKGVVEREIFDRVVLSIGITPHRDSRHVGDIFRINTDDHGFFVTPSACEPNKTNVEGIFVAGSCQGPKNIPDSIAHGISAAQQIIGELKECGKL